ncbi:MAG TPA: Hpt domain-containing protein [Polyangia bacterium]
MAQDFLKTGFVTEAEELLSGMEDGLLSLETSPDSAEALNGIFRAGHTIKGGAGLLNVVEIVAFTHVLENVLDRLRKKEITADQQLVTLLLGGCDVIRRLVTCVSEERPIVVDDSYDRVLAALGKYADAKLSIVKPKVAVEVADDRRERVFRISLHPREDLLETGQDPLMLLLELGDLGELLAVESDMDRLPAFTELEAQKVYLSWRVLLRSLQSRRAVEGVFTFVSGDNRVAITEVMNCEHFR